MSVWDDPLRATLAVAPFAAALALFAARRLGARVRRGEVALWIGWAALALQHRRLGLESSALLVAALGALLAAFRTAALLPRLATRDLPLRRSTVAVFAATLAFLLFLWPWSRAGRAPDGDEPYYLLLTASLARDFDVDLADEYRDRVWERFSPVEIAPQPGDPTGPDGEQWSRHSAFLPLLLAPLERVAGFAGVELGMVAIAAALAAAIFAAVRARWPGWRWSAPAVWAIVVLAPPLLVYSGRLWVELPAALAMAVALLALERRKGWLLVGALVALPLLKLRFLALALPLLALALFRFDRRRHPLRLGAALAGAVALLALWNFARYGNPLRMYAAADLDVTSFEPAALARGFAGLGFDVAFGLFAAAPLWLLLFPALGVGIRERTAPLLELATALPYLLFICARREWYGGWSPPFRYGVALLPLLALALAPLFRTPVLRTRTGAAGLRWLVALLGAATTAVALVAFLYPAWTFSLADGGNRALAELSELYSGDLLRFTPSTVRPRLATWLWLLSIPAAIAFAPLGRTARRSRATAVVGAGAVAMVLAGFAIWLAAAARVPTRIVQFEDPWVAKRGGGLYPGRWTIDRTRFDGGWILPGGSAVSFVAVAGGERAKLTLRAAHHGVPQAAGLELRAGDRLVASFAPPSTAEAWNLFTAESVALPRGEPLTIAPAGEAGPPTGAFWVVDKMEIDWR